MAAYREPELSLAKFIILDPNLKSENGHHREWDSAIATAAADAGREVVVYAHRSARIPPDTRYTLIPHFSRTTYAKRSSDPVSGLSDDCTYFSALVASELAALPRETFANGDIVLVPTVNEKHLSGFVSWMKSFDADAAPAFFVHLMLPSGISVAADGTVTVAEPERALAYRMAFREADDAGPNIRFFAGGKQVAAQYSVLAERAVEPLAVPLRPVPTARESARGRRHVLLFAGDAKREKGFDQLPMLVPLVCRDHPDWDFTVHANAYGPQSKDLAPDFEALAAARDRHRNFRLVTGWLDSETYRDLFDADCALFAYSDFYASKSSGVLWECISLGIPVVVPDGGWLARECAEWGAGYVTYPARTVENMRAALSRVWDSLPALLQKSEQAAARWRDANGAAATVRQLEAAAGSPTRHGDTASPREKAREFNRCPLQATVGGCAVAAAGCATNEYLNREKLRHFDISIFGAVLGAAEPWPHVRFQFVLAPQGRILRFRLSQDWPRMFGHSPAHGEDKKGPFIALRDDSSLAESLVSWRAARDRQALQVVAALLPAAVEAAARREHCSPAEARTWAGAATAMSERLLALLASEDAPMG